MWDEISDTIEDAVRKDSSASGVTHHAVQATSPLIPIEMKGVALPPALPSGNGEADCSNPHHNHHGEHNAVSNDHVDRSLFYSGVASHVFATVGLLMIGRFKSVMAPPANISMLTDNFLHGKGREFARAARSFAPPR